MTPFGCFGKGQLPKNTLFGRDSMGMLGLSKRSGRFNGAWLAQQFLL